MFKSGSAVESQTLQPLWSYEVALEMFPYQALSNNASHSFDSLVNGIQVSGHAGRMEIGGFVEKDPLYREIRTILCPTSISPDVAADIVDPPLAVVDTNVANGADICA
jgi:hypothetical protein